MKVYYQQLSGRDHPTRSATSQPALSAVGASSLTPATGSRSSTSQLMAMVTHLSAASRVQQDEVRNLRAEQGRNFSGSRPQVRSDPRTRTAGSRTWHQVIGAGAAAARHSSPSGSSEEKEPVAAAVGNP